MSKFLSKTHGNEFTQLTLYYHLRKIRWLNQMYLSGIFIMIFLPCIIIILQNFMIFKFSTAFTIVKFIYTFGYIWFIDILYLRSHKLEKATTVCLEPYLMHVKYCEVHDVNACLRKIMCHKTFICLSRIICNKTFIYFCLWYMSDKYSEQ